MTEQRAPSIGVQSILYMNGFEAVERAACSLARSAELAIHAGACSQVLMLIGDCSPSPVISDAQLAEMRARYGQAIEIRYVYFGENLGSASGHNKLGLDNPCDYLLIRNPDVVVAPRLLERFLEVFNDPTVGMVEAKQLPIEHPKDYQRQTGETEWATTACAMFSAQTFRELEGFDASSFFLYCDDVDFSWRVRLLGKRVIFHAAAVCFHDKRVSDKGQWQPSEAERYYSLEASLMLAHKWSRSDLVDQYLKVFARSDDARCRKARDVFLERKAAGVLPVPLDPDHKVARFVGYNYADHRFPL